MSKIRTIEDINFRVKVGDETQVVIIPKDTFIKVTEEMAIYLCNEDVEAMSAEERKKHRRKKKAVRSGFFDSININKPHEDYTHL